MTPVTNKDHHYQVTLVFKDAARWSYMVNGLNHADALAKAMALYAHKEGPAVPVVITIQAYQLGETA